MVAAVLLQFFYTQPPSFADSISRQHSPTIMMMLLLSFVCIFYASKSSFYAPYELDEFDEYMQQGVESIPSASFSALKDEYEPMPPNIMSSRAPKLPTLPMGIVGQTARKKDYLDDPDILGEAGGTDPGTQAKSGIIQDRDTELKKTQSATDMMRIEESESTQRGKLSLEQGEEAEENQEAEGVMRHWSQRVATNVEMIEQLFKILNKERHEFAECVQKKRSEMVLLKEEEKRESLEKERQQFDDILNEVRNRDEILKRELNDAEQLMRRVHHEEDARSAITKREIQELLGCLRTQKAEMSQLMERGEVELQLHSKRSDEMQIETQERGNILRELNENELKVAIETEEKESRDEITKQTNAAEQLKKRMYYEEKACVETTMAQRGIQEVEKCSRAQIQNEELEKSDTMLRQMKAHRIGLDKLELDRQKKKQLIKRVHYEQKARDVITKSELQELEECVRAQMQTQELKKKMVERSEVELRSQLMRSDAIQNEAQERANILTELNVNKLKVAIETEEREKRDEISKQENDAEQLEKRNKIQELEECARPQMQTQELEGRNTISKEMKARRLDLDRLETVRNEKKKADEILKKQQQEEVTNATIDVDEQGLKTDVNDEDEDKASTEEIAVAVAIGFLILAVCTYLALVTRELYRAACCETGEPEIDIFSDGFVERQRKIFAQIEEKNKNAKISLADLNKIKEDNRANPLHYTKVIQAMHKKLTKAIALEDAENERRNKLKKRRGRVN